MRKFLAGLFILLGVFFVLTRFAELNKILEVLKRGNVVFLVLALLVQIVWIYNLGAFYQSIYHVLGILEKRGQMIKLVTAAYFMSIAAPSGGLSGMAVYLADAQRRGLPTARVMVASVLYVWFEYVGTLTILVIGLGELAHRNHLHWSEITASLILLAGALGIGLLLYLGMKSASALGKTLTWGARAVNRILRPFLHHNYLSEDWAVTFAQEVSEGIYILRHNPRWVTWPLLFALTNKALLFIILTLCFLAFQVPIDIGTIVAGLSIAHLFLIVSPTPGGIGIVEGILAVALNGLGVALNGATVVSLAYRGFSFWVPFLVGLVTIRLVERAPKQAVPASIEPVSTPTGRQK